MMKDFASYSADWHGKIELRGLEEGEYQVRDYEMGRDLGEINSKNPFIEVAFKKYLLIEVSKM